MKRGQRWLACCLCAALLVGMTGCGSQSVPKEIEFVTVEDGTIQREQLAQAADFSYELLRQTAALEQENILVSPLSAWLALSVAGQGADGETAQAFQVFFQGLDQEQQRVLAAWMLQELQQESVKLANSVWCDDEFTVQEPFLQTAQQYYRAEVQTIDLQGAAAVKTVNRWIAEATAQRIPAMLKEIDTDAVMLLVNALTLDAQWQQPFERTDTYEQVFYCADGTEKTLDFLHQYNRQAQYLQWQQGQGILLPYADGRLELAVLLPAADSDCQQLLQQLSADQVAQLLADKTERTVQLALPKFEMNSALNLNAVCKAMGLGVAFDKERADFSRMADCPQDKPFIGRVLQNCLLRVDEEGTEAAAATVVEMRAESAMIAADDVIDLCCDRPFVYLVLERESQLPLFAGIYQGEEAQ